MRHLGACYTVLTMMACATAATAQSHSTTVTHEAATREATITYEPGTKPSAAKEPAGRPATEGAHKPGTQAASKPATETASKPPAHGIIRKAPAREAPPMKVAPVASTEAVAAAIAAAVRGIEKTEKPARPSPPRSAPPRVNPVPPRRYVVQWPSRRVELRWTEPADRVKLSWNDPDRGVSSTKGPALDEPPAH